MTERPPYRLPRNVIPQHYTLVLDADLGDAAFHGEATVDVLVNEPTDEVVLNAADLDISEARFVGDDAAAVGATIAYRPDEEQVVLHAEHVLPAGSWQLHMRFSGQLNDRLRGFYRSKFRAPVAKIRGPPLPNSNRQTPAGLSRAGTNQT